MHVVLRVDGGPQIGYGHLVRTHSLAQELSYCGHSVTVATTTACSVKDIFSTEVETVCLESRNNPRGFTSWLKSTAVDIVFTDAYPVDTGYQQAIREHVPLIVLQDDARHAVCADLFVNGNLYAADLDYNFVGQTPKTCIGPEYVLLREEIRNKAEMEPPWRPDPERALITMGGSDMQDLTPTIVRAFDNFNLRVDAIVGPGVSEQQEREIHKTARAVSADVRVTRDPDDLPERMFQADFAVSTASSTTYELLALGTPIISIPVAHNQEPIAKILDDRNLATVVDHREGRQALSEAMRSYVIESSTRRRRSKRGRNLVDGRGTRRIYTQIISLIKGEPRS